ncbi:MAG TPA: alpha/beta hydrolase [Candidatus Paceibacterota bacterium]|nr:alpha/beta hydrolase [Candidatus Paceibacterota bacterium]
MWKDPSPHIVQFVEVESGVRVEVLDWRGSGEAVLLLAGHGDTAHIFDDFAPHLADDFHVSALTRRGFGASGQPEQGYELARLVKDIAQVLEAMDLKRVHLVGHSIAGDEMTRFARMNPDRVGKMVYLEAAYDRVQARQLEATFPKLPSPPEPTTSELASPAGMRAFVARTVIRMPESEIRATRIFHPDGRFLRQVTPDRILAAVAGTVEHSNYESIRAPMLAIYAVPSTPVQLIPRYKGRYEAGDEETRRVLDRIFDMWKPAAKAQRDQFRRAVPHARVVELHGASHYIFISHQEQVLREVKAFLRTR